MMVLPQLKNYDSEPWKIPFVKRMQNFYLLLEQGKKVAIQLYRSEDTSTFRYRCYNVVQALEKSDKWGAVYFFECEYEKIADLLPKASLLVLTRVKWTLPLEWLTARAKAAGIPVLFDVDDRVFDLNALKLLTNTLAVDLSYEQAYDFWFADIARIQQAAALAEGFITTNNYLGDRLREKFGFDYQIIPNSLNQEQLEASEALLKQKRQKTKCKPFTIGYFSGTPSHINDFLEIYKELCLLMRKYEDIRLEVVGFMEFPSEMQPLLEQGRVHFTPLVDFIELQRLVAQVDVNIVPLVENSFTNCKSELKYFEAAAVEVVTVATPIYSYKTSIQNGENGFLCRPGEWFSTLEMLYLDKVDQGAICEKAREDVLKRYCGPEFVKQIENAYEYFFMKNKK